MQYSASIAVLGRLANAGIDTLTIAFGQAMCQRLPIGSYGEKVLADSMSQLTAKSFAADLLWFGVGVRHVLHDLVQTSQGCSLVALCAALTEAHSTSVSALVLFEIAKACGGPHELTPSIEQWKALINVTAPVFNKSTLGVRINQIARVLAKKPLEKSIPAAHPTDLAKLLLSVGEIVQGSLLSVSVEGGLSCSWVAAWAGFGLGLKVLMRDADGNVVYANFDTKETSAQVHVEYLADHASDNVSIVQSRHVLRSGTEFIRRCLRRNSAILGPEVFGHPGRLNWDTMLSDTFGDHFNNLVKSGEGGNLQLRPIKRREAALRTQDDSTERFMEEDQPNLNENQIFTRVIAIVIIIKAVYSSLEVYNGCAQRTYLRAINYISELRPCNEQVLFAINGFLDLYGPEECVLDCPSSSKSPPARGNLLVEFYDHMRRLLALCTCPFHGEISNKTTPRVLDFSKEYDLRHICVVHIALVVFRLMSLLDRIIIDTTLRPTAFGLHYLYERYHYEKIHHMLDKDRMLEADELIILNELAQTDRSENYAMIAMLFSAEYFYEDGPGFVAKSNGKIYCYDHVMEGLTDEWQEARKVHVGSGHIEYRVRLHPALYGQGHNTIGYAARRIEAVDTFDFLKLDTTPKRIDAQLIVDEGPAYLSLLHHITTDAGEIYICPLRFRHQLERAVKYKIEPRIPKSGRESWSSILRGSQFVGVHGGGWAAASHTYHTLRPHRGNILGRCIAISHTESAVALVKSHEEVEMVARYWVHFCNTYSRPPLKLEYLTLVS